MPGILNYERYLATLQTITELGNIFPSTQRTLTYYVGSTGTTQGWTATIEWMTLIVDQYEETASGTPNFNQSQVYGYYPGGTSTQYSTGTISIPAYMYTGPLLPATTRDIPISVVNISWLRGQETFDCNLAFIQNWEPGVAIGNPSTGADFEPLEPTTSTLTLVGPTRILEGQTATYVATSDIPISLGSPNPARLYANSVLVATENMVDHTSTFNITLGAGTYTLYSQFGGIGNYGTVNSNQIITTVDPYIPLLVSATSITPSKTAYIPGDTAAFRLEVVPDPFYTPSGVSVTSTVQATIINQAPPNTATQFYNDRFYSGKLTATFTVLW